jgi:hypothetical protein
VSRANRDIKAALKAILLPHLAAEGFSGRLPDLVRREGDTLHLLSVQYDKWGGGLFLEFAPHPAGDMTTSWGEVVPEAQLTVAHTPVLARARLQETGSSGSTGDMWFRFEGLDSAGCEDLVGHIVDLFPQVDAWLREMRAGPNISAFRPPAQGDEA